MKKLCLKLEQVELLKIILEKILIADIATKDDKYMFKTLKTCLNVLNGIEKTGDYKLEVVK